MFVKVKTWDNRSELRVKGRYHGWCRRIIWYEDQSNNIKLSLEDKEHKLNILYNNQELAQKDWERFKNGASALEIQKEQLDVS